MNRSSKTARTLLSSLALLLGSLAATPLTAQQFFDMPPSSWANDVTSDGSVVVGTWNVFDGFIWNWREDPAPTPVLGGDMLAVSDDGTVVAGNFYDVTVDATVAGRWTAATGWQGLGVLPGGPCGTSYSSAYDISGDGTIIVGLGWDGCTPVGFRWTAGTGIQSMELLGNGTNRCSTISGDGTAMGGFAQGSFSRTPAFWESDLTGELIDFDDEGEIFGFNEGGTLSVGTYRTSGNLYDAFVRNQSTGAMSLLPALNPSWNGQATDITEGATMIVGFDTIGLSREAWVWTDAGGTVSLNDLVASLGFTGVDPIYVCRAVSDDGTVIVGGGQDTGLFGIGGFILDLSESPWTNLFGGSPGINGTPKLAGSGSLVGGTTATLDLTDAAPSALTLAWLSFASVPLNAIGGTLHATPFANQFLFGTNVSGEFSASTAWPVGVPPGTEVWFQFIVQDASSVHGLTLSNGVKAVTP